MKRLLELEEVKALNLIELLVNKLFLGEAVNTNGLKILPLLINILLEPLFGYAEPDTGVQHCSFKERFLCKILPKSSTFGHMENRRS